MYYLVFKMANTLHFVGEQKKERTFSDKKLRVRTLFAIVQYTSVRKNPEISYFQPVLFYVHSYAYTKVSRIPVLRPVPYPSSRKPLLLLENPY